MTLRGGCMEGDLSLVTKKKKKNGMLGTLNNLV